MDTNVIAASNFVTMVNRARTLRAYGQSKKEVYAKLCQNGNDKGDAYFATFAVFNEA